MKRFQKILVPISFSDAAPSVIAFSSHLARWSEPNEIVFCHFHPNLDMPPSLGASHPEVLEPVDEAALAALRGIVREHGKFPSGTRISYHVEEANPVHRTLSLALEKDCDLVITGADQPEVAIRVVRKAPCSVCVVPAAAPVEVRKPMIAVDFSEYSRYACEIGIALASASHGAPPVLVHLSQIHRGYHWGTISREEFVSINEAYAKSRMDEFALDLDCPQDSFTTAIHHHESVPFGILDYAKKNDIDCIVAGCRGRDALSALLLGSDIEQILAHSPIPVLAVKTKGTGRSFLKSILGMDH